MDPAHVRALRFKDIRTELLRREGPERVREGAASAADGEHGTVPSSSSPALTRSHAQAQHLSACFRSIGGDDETIQRALAETAGGCDFDTSQPNPQALGNAHGRLGGTVRNVMTVDQAIDAQFLKPGAHDNMIDAGLGKLLDGRRQITLLG